MEKINDSMDDRKQTVGSYFSPKKKPSVHPTRAIEASDSFPRQNLNLLPAVPNAILDSRTKSPQEIEKSRSNRAPLKQRLPWEHVPGNLANGSNFAQNCTSFKVLKRPRTKLHHTQLAVQESGTGFNPPPQLTNRDRSPIFSELHLTRIKGDFSGLSHPSILSELTFSKAVNAGNNTSREMAYFELEALPNPKVVGEQLISLIKTPMVETIKLPGCVIEVNELFLNHSIRIMGCPGTELCILKNAITLKPENGTIQVDFKECSITMKIPREQTPETRMLFDVHSKASLHLLDCQLKVEHMQEPGSYIITGTSSSIEPEVMKCICINLRSVASVKNGAESFNKICVASPQVFHSANAIVISCSFLQFYTALCMGHNGTAKIEKSGFFRTKGPAIFATNPYKFYLEGSRFENCLENGIELRWENAENSNIEREVKIENNDFNNIRGHGLSLISDSSTLFSSNVYLTNNRVQNCRQDGIYIKSFQASLIEIRRNTVCAVNGNGICVLGTRCSIFYIKLSTIRDNGGCGVYLNESSCTIQECNISANGQSGVAVIGSPGANKVAEEEIEVNIRDSIMGENKQHGIAVMDICNLEVTVSKCKAYANKEYGIFLFYRDNLSTAISQSLSASIAIPAPLKQVGKVLLNGGEIVMNRKGGVHINQLFTHIDGTCIKDNGEYAIFLPIKRSEKYVAFAGSTIGKKCIQGVIGGKWGCVSIYPTGNKCGGACSCIIL